MEKEDFMMPKKILIVDDQVINRRILKKLLCDQYEIVEAENGAEALAVLEKQSAGLSAVILDLIMPVMDGYSVLEAMEKNQCLSEIPVIVATQEDKKETESRALELGARDFVSKPYNPTVLRKRLANLIELYESNVRIHRSERDLLTGLYNKDAFCRRAEEFMDAEGNGRYTLVVTDIERFKLVNDSFGLAEGDKLLKYIAENLYQNMQSKNGICARLGADHFAALIPEEMDEAAFRPVLEEAERSLADYPLSMKISLKFGVYPVSERDVSVALMCDRAMLASDSLKGQYRCVCAYYDDSIRQRMIREQAITDTMKHSLSSGHFQVYFQPKYDIRSERVAGAEALARWAHPELGVMYPCDFIPLFERNGFITELDRYMWDKTCEIVENWIKEGKKYVPISVNVSRKDIYQSNLPEILAGIVKKHGLRPNQLHLEITEAAYTENPEQLISVVDELKQLGFSIGMDDFGRGYSSLNMLSELPIDVLKLDMRFIQKKTDSATSRNILNFIISLAKWMDLRVIAEGVETHEQIEMLRSMDCQYVQGYYYAEPMSEREFAELVMNAELADHLVSDQSDCLDGALAAGGKAGAKVMLIADGEQANRAKLAKYFEDAYSIVEADNAPAAYKYIEEHFNEIAIVMLDLALPPADGFHLLEKLRVNHQFASIPVIATGAACEALEVRAFALGASDFLPAPYNMDIAVHRVQNVTARNTIQTLEREKRMLSKMRQLALEARLDQLTGLYNRAEMERRVQEFFCGQEGENAIFFMLDIDNFKNINDLYGHDRGDEVIKMVSAKLRELFRDDDFICRMGGDEFAVFMKARMDEAHLSRRLEQMCARLRASVEDTEISCSIGASIAPEHGTGYQTLYHNSDMALLTAKRLGKNRWKIYGTENRGTEDLRGSPPSSQKNADNDSGGHENAGDRRAGFCGRKKYPLKGDPPDAE
ncbi:MAG: EAL domain-containing protein [Cloacibacillus sp.]